MRESSTRKIKGNLPTAVKNDKYLLEAGDICRVLVLLSVALAIGIYIIATTVLITQDGAEYIELAQNLPKNPIDVIKYKRPFGYPLLIFLTHKMVTFFSQNTSVYSWVYSAQSVSLLCRVLSLIPLYLIGKVLVGSRRSFWGLLILVVLPYPAEFGSDVIREWPHILFLSTGLFFLIWGVRQGRWWMFAVAGVAAGLGHTVRPECAQIVIYGILWLSINLFRSKRRISRLKAVCLTMLLLIGFAVPAVPYMKVRGKILPPKLKAVISAATAGDSEGIEKSNFNDKLWPYTASATPTDVLRALSRLAQALSANLMYLFVLPWVVGLYCHFRRLRKILLSERLFVFALLTLYLLMMELLYIDYGYISRRHCMPMVVFTAFYIPVGLQIMARWISEKTKKEHSIAHRNRQHWFLALVALGIVICVGKFVRITPLRWEKRGYLKAAEWLKKNTKPGDIIALAYPDNRMSLYAERTMVGTETKTSVVSAGKVSSENWYHLAGTFDGEHQKLYINGKLAASKKSGFRALGVGTDSLAVGLPYAGNKVYFKGVIDEVRLYNRALSSNDIKALYNRQVSRIESGELIGCWGLEGNANDASGQPRGAMAFNGVDDHIDLSHLDLPLNLDEISVCVWVKPELLDRVNWILGNGAQFRIGVDKSRFCFWIQERPPGTKIPPKTAYVVDFVKGGSTQLDRSFNKSVREEYSVWVDKRKSKHRIVIYKIIE